MTRWKIRVGSPAFLISGTVSETESETSCIRAPTVSSTHRPANVKEDWHTRKKRYIEHLKTVDKDTLLVSLSDKVHNARSILAELRDSGPEIWAKFNAGAADERWYYGEVRRVLEARHPDSVVTRELSRVVAELEDAIERSG